MSSLDGQDQLLDEQIAYRARADEYFDGVIAELGAERELDTPVEQFRPVGDVLELVCGPGTWTPQLLDHAATVTAVDASREMIAIGSARVGADSRVRFVEANLFRWRPDRRSCSNASPTSAGASLSHRRRGRSTGVPAPAPNRS
jgi:SAM-dependent methyltransferase